MKTRFLFFLLLLLQVSSIAQRKVELGKAISEGLVSATIYGAMDPYTFEFEADANDPYSGKCMIARLNSKTDSALIIVLKPGQMLMCESHYVQDMVVTRGMNIPLAPHETDKVVVVSAMCSEMHDGAPNNTKFYTVGKMARKPLVAIAKVIQRRGVEGVPAQGAVWAYTDHANANDLRMYGADDATLRTTIAILNEAGVYTALNPKPEENQAIEAAPAVVATPTPAPAHSPSIAQAAAPTTPFDWWPIACGGVFLSAGTALVLVLRRKRDEDMA